MRFDPAADPWGTAMLGCLVICGFAVLWWIVAVAMRQPVRGTGRVMSIGLFGYLMCAVGGTAMNVMATPPPAPPPPPAGPAVVIEAKVPLDPDEDPKAAAAEKKAAAAKRAEAKRDATPAAKAEPAPDAKAEPTPATLDTATPVPAPVPAPVANPVELGPPTLAGLEALRFVAEVSHDVDKCADANQVAAAARELPGALSEVARERVDRAASRLEGCRRKIVWARALVIRRHRIDDREKLADAIPERLRAEGLSVLVTLRGAAHERIRIGGAALDATRARALLDGGLHDELADAGFVEITLANMQGSVKETPTVPTDSDLAAAELASVGLDRKIALP